MTINKKSRKLDLRLSELDENYRKMVKKLEWYFAELNDLKVQ